MEVRAQLQHISQAIDGISGPLMESFRVLALEQASLM